MKLSSAWEVQALLVYQNGKEPREERNKLEFWVGGKDGPGLKAGGQ